MASQVANLNSYIKTITVLNIDKQESTISPTELLTETGIDNSNDKYIVSDADEQLLILIEFKQIVHLKSMTIYSSPVESISDTSPPKNIHIFVTKDLNINFDDFDEDKITNSHKSVKCKQKKLQKGQRINLNIKFAKVRYLSIFIESNHNDTECTNINGICFKGMVDVKYKKIQLYAPKTKCIQCQTQYTKPIFNPLHDDQIILPITHNKQHPESKNIHSFKWKLEIQSHIERFRQAKDNEVTFRSDYHLINGNLIYFEITPNGWNDNCPPGDVNIWLSLHRSNTDNVKFRFQSVCKDVDFIGEKDEILMPYVQYESNCRDIQVRKWAISTNNAMKLSKFKHLNSITFLLNVTVNPETFQMSLDDQVLNNKNTMKENKENNKDLFCDGNVTQCESVQTLTNTVNECDPNINAQTLIDLFIHSIFIHGDDEQYEYIVKMINACDITQCTRFKRHYLDRNIQHDIDTNDSVREDIMDKIHCYYNHSQDIGHKLTQKQRDELNNIIEEKKDDDIDSYLFQNNLFLKLREFASKAKTYNILQQNRYSRFVIKHHNIPFTTESKQEPTVNVYSYGQKFYYTKNTKGWKNVLPRFKSLKEEMLYNTKAVMSSDQFAHENHKAGVHMRSYYCQKYYPEISQRQILALIIYCGYTHLQYEFSKTFRECIHHHNQFCHFGFLLSTVINDHG
eukprot:78121_1